MKHICFTFLFVFIFVSLFAQNKTQKAATILFKGYQAIRCVSSPTTNLTLLNHPLKFDAEHFQFEGDTFKWLTNSRRNSRVTLYFWNGLYKVGIMPIAPHSPDYPFDIDLNALSLAVRI